MFFKQKVEIARSFSFKLNLGNYQMADFFCSEKTETSPDKAEEVSEKLYEFCRKEVQKSIASFKREDNKEVCESCGGVDVYGGEQVVNGLHPKCRTSEGFKSKNL